MMIHALSNRTASILDFVIFLLTEKYMKNNCFHFQVFESILILLPHKMTFSALGELTSLYFSRERIMPMRRKVRREKCVTGGGARDVGEVNTIITAITITVEIIWELPLQIIRLLVSIQQWPSNLQGHGCQTALEDLQWVEGSRLLLISHDLVFLQGSVLVLIDVRCACKFMLGVGGSDWSSI